MTTCKGLNSETQKSFPPFPLSVSHSLTFCLFTFSPSASASSLSHSLTLHSRSLSALSLSRSLEVSLALSSSTVWLSCSVYVSSFLHSQGLSSSLHSSFQQKVGFYFVYVGKTCKGCSFKWFSCKRIFLFMFVEWFACKAWAFMQFLIEKHVKVVLLSDFSCKTISFCLWFDFRVKFGFLCDFLWKSV